MGFKRANADPGGLKPKEGLGGFILMVYEKAALNKEEEGT